MRHATILSILVFLMVFLLMEVVLINEYMNIDIGERVPCYDKHNNIIENTTCKVESKEEYLIGLTIVNVFHSFCLSMSAYFLVGTIGGEGEYGS